MEGADKVEAGPTAQAREEVFPRAGVSYRLSALLAVTTAVAAGSTVFVPDVLRGPAVMQGSVRGIALVLLVGIVPLLVGSMWLASGGSVRGLVVWLGTLAVLLYNGVLLLFATPFNPLFLVYCALWGLAFWATVALLSGVDLEAFARRYCGSLPVRGLAIYLWVVAAFNGSRLLELVPELFSEEPAFLAGTGLTTNPVFVQDFAFWVPLMVVAAWWLWRRRPWGYLLTGGLLVAWVLTAVIIAVDQAMGHAADPASSVAASENALVFAVAAVVMAVPAAIYLRRAQPAPPQDL